jgi:chromosome segregation ATPase|tara:strand:+ start:245 stop:478 length:234 start_codon:yes stop_codon:yes gene_type:complete
MLNVEDARSELESVKEASSGIASEIESKVDELTTIKDNLEDGVSQLEDYIYALQGIEDTLENLENARNEAEDHDISY